MTADINDDLGIPVHRLPAFEVAIVSERALVDVALLSLVEGFGYRAVLVDLTVGEVVPATAKVVIVRSQRALVELGGGGAAVVVGIGVPVDHAGGIEVVDAPHGAVRLRQVLRTLVSPGVNGRVHLSPREQEVVVTYTLGATVKETARLHYIAETTVRSHFRRVMIRYAEAGRPVSNKSQLLIQLIADGWVDRDRLAAA
ncbi:LuxR C-terminal-related transcriptional regulator [Gordonia sp. CPCC 205515]|uniref:helix-turn-helix transcriptional regulator n=1 Tax=Gordonia sp. CPCC 205515 TaxID=3140791 RepID=UPI003AF33C57